MRITGLISILAAPLLAAAQDAPSFAKDIAPIFAANCAGCHGSKMQMGSLDLDSFEGLQKGGAHGAVVVAGKSAESKLYLMLTGKVTPLMPMGGKPLGPEHIETVRKWIDAGALPPAPGEMAAAKRAEPKIPDIKPRVAVKPQIFGLAYRPDGKTIALAGFKEVRLADAASGKIAAVLAGAAETVTSVVFSADGRLLAATGGLPGRKGEVRIWDVDKQEVVRTIEGHDDVIYAAVFSPDGKWIATAGYDKLIKLWDVESGKEIRTLKDHIDAVYALVITPDGKRLISAAADRTVKVWDTATGQRLYTMGEPLDGLNTVAVDPTGRLAAAAGLDKTIRIWELGEKNGKLINSLIAHEDAILKLAWSPDGKTLVSSSSDRTIKAFRAEDLSEIRSIPNQADWACGLAFSPDGKSIAAGRFDGSLSIYETERFVDTLATVRAGR